MKTTYLICRAACGTVAVISGLAFVSCPFALVLPWPFQYLANFCFMAVLPMTLFGAGFALADEQLFKLEMYSSK